MVEYLLLSANKLQHVCLYCVNSFSNVLFLLHYFHFMAQIELMQLSGNFSGNSLSVNIQRTEHHPPLQYITIQLIIYIQYQS